MAPVVDGRDRRSSWRPFRATAGTSALVMPSWTTGDDGDEEAELEARKSRPRRRFRNRHQARQDNPQAPNDGIQAGPSAVAATAPPDPSPTGGGSDDSGIDSGVDSGIESSGEDDDGFGETTRVPRPRPPPPTTTSSIPGSVPATVTDGVSTSSGPSPGNRTPHHHNFFARPPPPEHTDSGDDSWPGDSGPDDGSDSEDESSTLFPTSTFPPPGSGNGFLPTETATDPLPASSTSSSGQTARQRHHQNVETALTVVGSVAGVICLGVGIWLLIRFFKRRRDSSPAPAAPSTPSTPKPSRRARFLAHIPILKTCFANRSWFNIDDPYVNDKDPRFMPADDELLGYLPDEPVRAATAPAPQMRVINVDSAGYYTTTMRTSDANRTIPTQEQVPYSLTETSLSSAFGNGTYMAPTELHPPPPPYSHPQTASHRDTVYTQSSDASSLPRFRTVNSWVRQQTGRVRRSTPPPVPEQGYGLMMPDGEEPRRVVVAPQGVGYAT